MGPGRGGSAAWPTISSILSTTTSAGHAMPLHDQLLELGIDVRIGPDPVQGKGTDLTRMAAQPHGQMWALILSPVENIRDASDAAWERVAALIRSWRKYRG
jgi:hypothetical protein